jgi:hypothetical protein
MLELFIGRHGYNGTAIEVVIQLGVESGKGEKGIILVVAEVGIGYFVDVMRFMEPIGYDETTLVVYGVLIGIAGKNRFTFGVEGIVPFMECIRVIHPKGRNIAPHGRKQFIGIFHGHDIQVAMGKTVHMIVRGILQFNLQSRPEPFFDFFLGLP